MSCDNVCPDYPKLGNDFFNLLADLSGAAFILTHVHDNLTIFIGRAVCGGNSKAKGRGNHCSTRGGLRGVS